MPELPPALWRQIAARACDGILVMQPAARPADPPAIVWVNAEYERVSGHTLNDLAGKPVSLILGPGQPDLLEARRRLHAGENVNLEQELRRADGSTYWAEVHSFALRSAAGKAAFWVSIHRDITERRRAAGRLAMLGAALEHASDAIMIARTDLPERNSATIAYVNEAFSRQTGYAAGDVQGKTTALLFGAATNQETVARMRSDLRELGTTRQDLEIARADGSLLWVEYHSRTLDPIAAGEEYVVVILRDISRRKEREEAMLAERDEIEFAARHDPLTGVYNRRALEERLARLIADAREGPAVHALAVIDLDGFRAINDVTGHPGGDSALCRIAETIAGHLRQHDMCARLGGDEFVVILENCSLRDAMRSLDVLRQKIRTTPLVIKAARFTLTASIGVAAIGAQTPGAAEAMALADASCYSAKRAGGDRIAAELTSEA